MKSFWVAIKGAGEHLNTLSQVRMLTDPNSLVHPLAGSCVTGEVTECLDRKWICVGLLEDYPIGAPGTFRTFLCGGDEAEGKAKEDGKPDARAKAARNGKLVESSAKSLPEGLSRWVRLLALSSVGRDRTIRQVDSKSDHSSATASSALPICQSVPPASALTSTSATISGETPDPSMQGPPHVYQPAIGILR